MTPRQSDPFQRCLIGLIPVILAGTILLVHPACARQVGPERAAIAQAIRRGVVYVQEQQLPSGEFPAPFLKRINDHLTPGPTAFSPNVFCTGVMVYSLAQHREFRESSSARKALHFLESMVQSNGCWQFYTPESSRYAVFIPDVDDTAVISLALREMGRTAPDNVAILLSNVQTNGAMGTWIYPTGYLVQDPYDNRTSDEHFGIHTPDVVVNANALAYLAHRGVDAPTLCAYLNRAASSDHVLDESTYYLHLTSVAYAYAKALRCGALDLADAVDRLGRQLLEQRPAPGTWTTALQNSLALIAWLAMREVPDDIHSTATHLLATQNEDGSWPADLYFGSVRYPNTGWGSPSLTTAFAVEALSRYAAHVDAH